MSYHHTTAGEALRATAFNWFRPPFLRAVGRAAVDWQFAQQGTCLKRVALGSLVADNAEVRLSLSAQEFGESPVLDVVALCTLVRRLQPRAIFEFGTFTGHTTLNLALNAAPDCQIWTLDLPPNQRAETTDLEWEKNIDDRIIGRCFRNSPQAAQITQIFADSREFDPTPYLGRMDFVFVDAAHAYEFVVNDTQKALQMLSPQGVVAWHDYSRACPGVWRYVHEMAQQREVCLIDGTQVAFCRKT